MPPSAYLDTCVWCRPFDNLRQRRIHREYRAVLHLLERSKRGEMELVVSDAVHLELDHIPEAGKRESVATLIAYAGARRVPVPPGAQPLAGDLARTCGLGALDAAHIAIAVRSGVEVFLTVDDAILNRRECIEKFGIRVQNPVELVEGPHAI